MCTLTFLFPVCNIFFSAHCCDLLAQGLQVLCGITVDEVYELDLFLIFMEICSGFLSLVFTTGLSYLVFVTIKYIFLLLLVPYHKGMLNSVKTIFCVYSHVKSVLNLFEVLHLFISIILTIFGSLEACFKS